jgi:hypothetical protein
MTLTSATMAQQSADPATARAKERRNLGFSRELQQDRTKLPKDPSHGGSAGYPVWFREQELQKVANGEDTTASSRSHERWAQRLIPYQQTGNHPSQALVGRDQWLLCILLTIYPDAGGDEATIFLYDNGGNIYNRADISKRLDELRLSKKVSSTEAYQAFEPRNILRAELFWTRGPPLGVYGVHRFMFVDFDEFGVAMEKLAAKHGHSHTSIRIRKPGHYCKSTKLTVLYAIEPGDPRVPPNVDGSIENPRRWIKVTRVGGTNAVTFAEFADLVCTRIETHRIPGTDDHRVYLWDNLGAHQAPIVAQTVEARNAGTRFTIVPRIPYQPKYAPIEYKICDLVSEVREQSTRDWTVNDLEQAIYRVAGSMGRDGDFDNTFDHCGYTVNGL